MTETQEKQFEETWKEYDLITMGTKSYETFRDGYLMGIFNSRKKYTLFGDMPIPKDYEEIE